MAGLTDWHLSRDTPRKSSGVSARPQRAATGAAVGSAKCEDVTNPDKEENAHSTKNASDEELQYWADLMRKQKLEHFLDDDGTRRLTKFKATTGDALNVTVPQFVIGAHPSIHVHGPGGDGIPEAFNRGQKYARAAPGSSALKENVTIVQKWERE